MAEAFFVDVPSADLAEALMQRLRAYPTELDQADNCVVRVTLAGNPDRAIGDVFDILDQWLAENSLTEVRVHLGARVYRLGRPHAPPV
jgi:hypothetical protein